VRAVYLEEEQVHENHMNVVILHGNLTADPVVRYTPKGQAICEFGIAINKRWKTESGEEREKVGFFGCYIWGKRGEAFAQFHRKGGKALVRGELAQESWEDKETGKKHSKTRVEVTDWEFAGGKREEAQAAPAPRAQKPQAQAEAPAGEAQPDDDVPF
jgi:single-strand DNA-binding protein